MCAVTVGPDEPIRLRVSQLSASALTLAVVVVWRLVQDRWDTVVVGVAARNMSCSLAEMGWLSFALWYAVLTTVAS